MRRAIWEILVMPIAPAMMEMTRKKRAYLNMAGSCPASWQQAGGTKVPLAAGRLPARELGHEAVANRSGRARRPTETLFDDCPCAGAGSALWSGARHKGGPRKMDPADINSSMRSSALSR
jgi:hypothetical protein